jgi:hypothetical protein
MKIIKVFILIVIALSIVSCSSGASYKQQQEVKAEVMKLLKQEYKQPFKLLSFEYKYKSHTNPAMDCVFLYCKSEKYGTYYFKVKAINNPIIIMDFSINDGLATKESIKPMIDSFKSKQLKEVYCDAFAGYYGKIVDNYGKLEQPYTTITTKFCNSRGQTSFHISRDYYLKHQDQYK